MKTFASILVISLSLGLFAFTAEAQGPGLPTDYNGFHLEGTIVSSEAQAWKSPGPPGAGMESVCLLRVRPHFHYALPESAEVEVWMQGGGVVDCLEWGEERAGNLVEVDGYLARVVAGGIARTAVKALEVRFLGE